MAFERRWPALLLAGLFAVAAPAWAQAPNTTQAGMEHDMMAAMAQMNRTMMATPMTGDPDRDLIMMMLPHHQGAIEMARIYLRQARDPQIRRMAQRIIADQQHEIGEMQVWLARHPHPAPAH